MKTLISTLLIAFCMSNSFATVRTVSNNANSPGQYTSLQTAIDNATNGDTIYVHGSPTSYGTISLNRQLTLIGPGYNPQKDLPLTAVIGTLNVDSVPGIKGSSNSTIMGFVINDLNSSTGGYIFNNLSVSLNKIGQINFSTSGVSNGAVFSHNAIDYIYSLRSINNLILKNNVIYYFISFFSSCTSVLITNNLFFHVNVSTGLNIQDFSTVTNNIFLNVHPNTDYSTFNNNLIFNSGSDVLPYGTNTGSGNINGQAPIFVNVPDYSGIDLSYDYRLTAASPGHNAGTDGTDMGPFGGINPLPDLTGTPPIPQIKVFNINNTVVTPSTPLNIYVKAKKQ